MHGLDIVGNEVESLVVGGLVEGGDSPAKVLALGRALFVVACIAPVEPVGLKKLPCHFAGQGPEAAGGLVLPLLCSVVDELTGGQSFGGEVGSLVWVVVAAAAAVPWAGNGESPSSEVVYILGRNTLAFCLNRGK